MSIFLCASMGAAGCSMPSAGGPKGAPSKAVSTVAGEPRVMGSTDASGSGATFAYPAGVAVVTGTPSYLYIADSFNSTIRQLNLTTGAVKTIAGVAGVTGYFDNSGYPANTAALFYNPEGIAADGTNLYVADSGNNAIRKVVISTGIVTTIAGNPSVQPPGSTDGTGTNALFNNPLGICYDGVNLFVADSGNSTIRTITLLSNAVATIAGQAAAQGSADGTGSAATFTWPEGIAFDSTNGCLYVVDTGNGTIRQIAVPGVTTSVLTTIAGQAGVKGDADGTGLGARFNWPEGIAIDGTNTNLFVADTLNSTIRQVVIATGDVTTVAGQGGVTGSADGAGDSATFNNPMRLVANASDLYVADTYNETIRLIK